MPDPTLTVGALAGMLAAYPPHLPVRVSVAMSPSFSEQGWADVVLLHDDDSYDHPHLIIGGPSGYDDEPVDVPSPGHVCQKDPTPTGGWTCPCGKSGRPTDG